MWEHEFFSYWYSIGIFKSARPSFDRSLEIWRFIYHNIGVRIFKSRLIRGNLQLVLVFSCLLSLSWLWFHWSVRLFNSLLTLNLLVWRAMILSNKFLYMLGKLVFFLRRNRRRNYFFGSRCFFVTLKCFESRRSIDFLLLLYGWNLDWASIFSLCFEWCDTVPDKAARSNRSRRFSSYLIFIFWR